MSKHHISVCICTFKRPALLAGLLDSLQRQQTNSQFTYEVVVADNDAARSAEATVAEYRRTSTTALEYCVEPEPNIALARNKAIESATGDLIAFLDDDEFAVDGWLLALVETMNKTGADAVLGPVVPHFGVEPPAWVRKGRFFDRPRHATGTSIPWPEARSGNVLFRRQAMEGIGVPFRPQFATAGEDVDFFRRLAERGCRLVWCDEAVAYEHVPDDRCNRRYLLRRALLRGSNFPKHPTNKLRNIGKSIVALPVYTLALPVLALAGHHVFLTYLIKTLDHGSRLLAFAGVPVVKQRHT